MHEENVRTFQRGTEAINRLDAGAAARDTHPDAVFEPRRAETQGAFLGREGMKRFVAGLMWRYKDHGDARLALAAVASE